MIFKKTSQKTSDISFLKGRIIFSFLFLSLFSGCSSEKESIPDPKLPPVVPVLEITPRDFQETLEISGTLRPAFEAKVASEASGTISQIYAHEGDMVETGQLLAQISASDNKAEIDLNNAHNALQNALAQWELSKKQAAVQLKSADIQIGKAEIDLLSADRSNSSTNISVEAQEESAKSSVEIAKLTLQNATESLSELKENLDLQENILREREKNIIASTVVSFRNALEGSDAVLGFSQERKGDNDRFEIYLGFNNPQVRITAELLAKKVWKEFLIAEKEYYKNPQIFPAQEIVTSAKKIQEVLAQTSKVLQSSATGERLSGGELAQMQGNIAQHRSAIEGSISQISDITQTLNDFALKKPQQLRSAILAISEAQDRLQQAKRNLDQVKSGGVVNTAGTEGRFDAAQKGVEIAKLQHELTKQQGDISIQQAKTQVDIAKNQVRAAELALSKLSITAPFSGVVTKKNIDIGDTVSMGNPLFVISDIDHLLLKGDVDPDTLSQISLGQESLFSLGGEEKKGVISKINAVANDITKRIDIEITLSNKNHHIPANIFLTTKLPLLTQENTIMIPYGSLISQVPPSIFLVGEGEKGGDPAFFLEKKVLVLGKRSGDMIQVREGLFTGDLLVDAPLLGLREGDEVTPQKQDILKKPESDENETKTEMQDGPLLKKAQENISGVQISEPKAGEEFQRAPILFRGIAPKGTSAVEINGYRLSSFISETGKFLYRADIKYNNLVKGENIYQIKTLDAKGNTLEEISLPLFFNPS